MLHKRLMLVFGLVLIASMVLAACAPKPPAITTPTVAPATAVPPPPPPPEPGGPIPAEGLVACLPLPELAFSTKGGPHLAKLVGPTYTVSAQPSAAPATDVAQEAGKIYLVGIFEDITSLNYWQANGPDNTVWNSYILGPQRISMYSLSEKTFQFVPGIASGMPGELTQEGDYWTATIALRQDVMWSDGTPVTAKDMAFMADTAMRFGLIAGNWGAWYDAGYLDHIEAVDDYTVKIVYHTKPGMARHQYGTLMAPILAEHFWKPLVDAAAAPLEGLTKPAADAAQADKDAYAAKEVEAQNNLYAIDPTGESLAGAFTFVKWEKGAFAENAAHAGYYGTGTTVTEYVNGAYQETQAEVSFTLYGEATGDKALEFTVGPHVASAVYTIYGSQDAAILALRAGEIDFMLNPLGLQRGLLSQVEGDSNLTVIKNSVNGFRYMAFNHRRQPMNDCSFRQAVAVLIDKEFVTNTILQGIAFSQYTVVPSGNAAWYFEDVPLLGKGLTREQRINLAVAILKQAGYTWEGGVEPTWDADNRMVAPGGALIMPDGTPVPPLTMLAPSPGYDPLRSTFAIWIEAWLNEAGIPLTAKLEGFNVIVPKIFTEQNFDFYILGWSLGMFPDYVRDFFHSEGAVPDGNNAAGYMNPEFDAASDKLLECDSFETCKPISDQLQITLATELPYVVLFDTGVIEAYRSASVEYPYTDVLSGLQYFSGMPATVEVK